MEEKSRIRFNPVTKEIEIEGTEEFVKTYFDKLQAMIAGTTEKKTAIKKEPKPATAAPVKTDKKKPEAVKERPRKKAANVADKRPGEQRITSMASVIGLIQGSAEGISTVELKEKTGLKESQIWAITSRAKKKGKIKQAKRGLYVGA